MSNLDLALFGKPRSFVSTDPAANTETTVTLPSGAGKKWLLLSASIQVVQGASQTPLINLVIKDSDGVTIGTFPGASAGTSVSTTSQYNWSPGAALTAGAGATVNTAPLPAGLVLGAAWTISTSTTGKGAATDLGALAVWVLGL